MIYKDINEAMAVYLHCLKSYTILKYFGTDIEILQDGSIRIRSKTEDQEAIKSTIQWVKQTNQSLAARFVTGQNVEDIANKQLFEQHMEKYELAELVKYTGPLQFLEQLDASLSHLCVYPKAMAQQIEDTFDEPYLQNQVVNPRELFLIVSSKFDRTLSEEHNCKVLINTAGVITIKGREEDVDEVVHAIKKKIKSCEFRKLLTHKSGTNLSEVEEALKKQGFLTIDNKKANKILNKFSHISALKQYIETQVIQKDGGDFIGGIFRIDKVEQAKRISEFFQRQASRKQPVEPRRIYRNNTEQELDRSKVSVTKPQSPYKRYPNNYRYPVPSKIYRQKQQFGSVRSNCYEAMIDKLVYDGLRKFNNFRTKLHEMQLRMQARIEPTQAYQDYFLRIYCNSSRLNSILQQLNFFFQDLFIYTYQFQKNYYVDGYRLNKGAEISIWQDPLYQDFVLSRIKLTQTLGRLSILVNRKEALERSKGLLEALLSKKADKSIRLLELKHQRTPIKIIL